MRVLIPALLVLAGCAGEPIVAASTPAMVAVCAPDGAPRQSVVALAQRECVADNRNAELISGPGEVCFGTGAFRSRIFNYRCVR